MTSSTTGPHRGRPINRLDVCPERFWSKVQIGAPDECWRWLAFIKPGRDARAIFSIKHAAYNAARVAYVLAGGNLVPGGLICHTCDNPSCVNPRHLYQGSPHDNTMDMIRRGRRTTPAGAKHPNAKLTTEQVIRIRERFAAGETRADLAREYGVSWTGMDDIYSGRRYKDAQPC